MVTYISQHIINMDEIATSEPESYGEPSHLDIVVAPFVFLALLLAGLILFSIFTQPFWWWSKFTNSRKLHSTNQSDHANDAVTKSLLSADELQCLHNFRKFQNNPVSLFKLALPCILSVAFCPATIYSGPTVVEFFYPEKYGGMPVINDVIQAFLMPAGLVYAIAFGFALQNALQSQDGSMANLTELATLLRQCTAIVERLGMSKDDKRTMIECMKTSVINWMKVVLTGRICLFQDAGLLKITDILKRSDNYQVPHRDERLINELFPKVFQLEAMLAKCNRASLPRINVVQWIFLELLGFISFFGILLVKASSYRLELTICMLTVFTISAFAYVLADIDSPYHGFFRVDLSMFLYYMEDLERRYDSGYMQNRANGLNGINA